MKRGVIQTFKEHRFLFSELVKRDFKKKYKRTVLGLLWSVLSPLLTLLVMRLVFTRFFGSSIEHYTIYLFCGNIVFSFFNDASSGGMSSLLSNANIFTKINVPKYLFLFSKNISSLINFGLTFLVFLLFCIIDGVPFTAYFFTLIIPILCLVIFNLGVGLILSALFVFFRDIQYLWSVFTMLLMYMSAIFYNVSQFGAPVSYIFYANPIYVYINYFRSVVLEARLPRFEFIASEPLSILAYHALAIGIALLVFGIGALIYKKCNHRFLYYV